MAGDFTDNGQVFALFAGRRTGPIDTLVNSCTPVKGGLSTL